MKNSAEDQIQEMVDRETKAWDNQDVDTLVSLFHPDMVWPWPKDEHSHNPVDWICPMGRYDRDRWKSEWQTIFKEHTLIHNRRKTIRITVTKEGDGGFAVVDVDTLWRNRQTGKDNHWKGRACKVYAKTGSGWKLISHTGLLEYES